MSDPYRIHLELKTMDLSQMLMMCICMTDLFFRLKLEAQGLESQSALTGVITETQRQSAKARNFILIAVA